MIAKVAYFVMSFVAAIALALVLAIFTIIVFFGWELPRYYRKLELRFIYHGDEAARDRDEYG